MKLFAALGLIVSAGAFAHPIAGQAAPAREDRGAFVLLRGSDTLAVERFIRTSAALQSFLHAGTGPRVQFFATIAPGEMVSSFTLSVWAPGVAESAAPTQRIPMTLRGDTVVAQTAAGVQRIPTRYGAIFFLNGSIAATEIGTRRARAVGGSGDFTFFNTGGGASLPVKVTPLGADSMLVDLAGLMHRFAVDAVGRILGGVIPSQNVRIVRLGAAAAAGLTLTPPPNVEITKPDYSAPAGAPYTAEDVSFAGPNGSHLGGTLTKPRGDGPFPAAITISGSGQQDRDEFIPYAGGIRLFRQIADTLSRRGIAVLRVDDRGLGESTGDATTSTTADFADDTRAAIAYLRTRQDIDGARIALIGHSEGGVIAPMVAATDPQVRAIVLLAGTASNGLEIIRQQQRYGIDHTSGLTATQRDSAYAVAATALNVLAASNVWMRFFNAYDPAIAARKVKAATLIVQGATDRQVPAAEADKLAALIRSGGNRDVTVRILPNVNHLFLADPDGNFANYDKLPSNAIVSDALGAIADWAALKLSKSVPKP